MNKFWFFFYGLPNIYGLAFSLIGLFLQAALMISGNALPTLFWIPLWIPLCLGLYLLGWIMGWWVQNNQADLQFERTVTAEDIANELKKLSKQVKGRIPDAAYTHVQNIEALVLSVLPHLVSGKFANQDLHTVKQAVFDYLPTTLENYLRLPTAYANMHPLDNGKTAKTLLIEQLVLLDNGLQDITHSIFKNDAQSLLANQRFLQSRIGSSASEF